MWVVLLLILSLIPAGYALSIYSGTVYSGDVLTAGKDQYTIIGLGLVGYERNYPYLRITRQGTINETMRIPFTKCVSSSSMTYCFLEQTIDYSSTKAVYDDRIEPKLKISITTFDPEITIARPKSLLVDYGVDTPINITITNRGKKETTVTYTEIIPGAIFISAYTNMLLENSRLYTTLTIPPNSTTKLQYTLRALSYTNASWGASYTYTASSGEKNGTVPKLSIQVRPAIDFKEYISKTTSTNLENSDNTTYRLTITNNDVFNSAYEHIILDSGALQILSVERLGKIDSSIYEYTGVIPPKTTVNHTLIFTSAYTGLFHLRLNASVDVADQKKVFLSEKNYTVKVSGITPKLLLSTTTAKPGDQVLATVVIENSDTKNSYHDITGVIHFFGDEPFSATTILQSENRTVATRLITIPQTNQTTWVVTLDGTYRTVSGQVFPFKTNATIKLFVPIVTSANTTIITSNNNISSRPINTTTNTSRPSSSNASTPTIAHNTPAIIPPEEKKGILKIFSEIGDFFSRLFGGASYDT